MLVRGTFSSFRELSVASDGAFGCPRGTLGGHMQVGAPRHHAEMPSQRSNVPANAPPWKSGKLGANDGVHSSRQGDQLCNEGSQARCRYVHPDQPTAASGNIVKVGGSIPARPG